MESSYICSYIIPYVHSVENLKILKSMLSILGTNPRIQKIIVETGEISVLKNIDLKSDYLFVESSIWNVGWLFNCGVKMARSENLFFGTFEYLPVIEAINSIMGSISDERFCVYLQSSLIELTHEQTIKRYLSKEFPKVNIPYEGVVYYTRDGFRKVGGWDENVYNKDLYVIQDARNKSIVNIGQINGISAFKLIVDLPTLNEKLIKYSSVHLDKVIKLDQNQTIYYLNNQSRANGNYNKYYTKNIMLV